MSLITYRNIILAQDTKDLYKLVSLHKSEHKLLSELFEDSLESFKQKLYKKLTFNYFHFKLISRDKCTIGFMFAYDYKIVDCHMKVFTSLPESCWNNDFRPIHLDYLHFLFSYFSIRKIYVESWGHDHKEGSFYRQQGFQEETVLRNYHYKSGEYYNHIYYSIDYATFYETHRNELKSYI